MGTKFFQINKSEYASECGASEIEYIGIEEQELARIAAKLKTLKEIEAIKDCFKVSYLWALAYEYYDEDGNALDNVDFSADGVEIKYYISGIGSIGFRANEKYTDEYLWADILYLEDGEVHLNDINLQNNNAV